MFDKKAYNKQRYQTQQYRSYHSKYYQRYYQEHKEHYRERDLAWKRDPKNHAGYYGRMIAFPGKNKRIYLSFIPRTGKCSVCKEKKRTVMHHAKGYYIIFPWYGIEELCVGCHKRVHSKHLSKSEIRRRWYLKHKSKQNTSKI